MKNLDKRIVLANTFTPFYDEFEDRLRVVVNYVDVKNRIDFMITRNFIIDFISSIDDFMMKYYMDDIVVKNSVQTTTKSDDTGERECIEKTDSGNLELFHLKNELLIKIDFSYQADSKKTFLQFTSKESISRVLLDSMMLQQFIKSMKLSIPYFKWGISQHF